MKERYRVNGGFERFLLALKLVTVSKGVRKGGLGLNRLSLIFYKNFITCTEEINCFRILFAVNLSTYCKYHRMNLHANVKAHCIWVKSNTVEFV